MVNLFMFVVWYQLYKFKGETSLDMRKRALGNCASFGEPTIPVSEFQLSFSAQYRYHYRLRALVQYGRTTPKYSRAIVTGFRSPIISSVTEKFRGVVLPYSSCFFAQWSDILNTQSIIVIRPRIGQNCMQTSAYVYDKFLISWLAIQWNLRTKDTLGTV